MTKDEWIALGIAVVLVLLALGYFASSTATAIEKAGEEVFGSPSSSSPDVDGGLTPGDIDILGVIAGILLL